MSIRHLLTAALWAGSCLAGPAQPPNIVLILADDMGFSDLGSYGSEIETPNLDRLAENGLRFTQFYNAGKCAPTRAALLTGLYNHRAGVGHMVADFGLPSYRGRLDPQAVTMAEALGLAGYSTIAVGKWHVGTLRGSWPLDRGFDRFYGSPPGDLHYFRMFEDRFLARGDRVIETGEGWFSTEAYTAETVRAIAKAAALEKPFFAYLAYFSPHYPLQARERDIVKYRGRYRDGWSPSGEARHRRQLELAIVDERWTPSDPGPQASPPWSEVPDPDEMDLRRAIYAAQVEEVDRGVGEVVAALERAGVLQETLLVFLSDNGADAAGGPFGFSRADRGDPTAPTGSPDSYASMGSAWAGVSNMPFRGYKGEAYEGGIATPLIVHWPEGVSAHGELRSQVGHVIDLLPTFLDVAGAEYPAKKPDGSATIPLQGRSLVPTFADKPIERDPLYWEHMGARAVRDGRWKLVSKRNGGWELFDLEADRTETHDLAAGRPDRVRRLEALYNAWARANGVRPWAEIKHLLEAR